MEYEKATLWIGTAVYRPKAFSAEIGPDSPAVLADFQSGSNQRAPEAVSTVPPGTTATLGILVKREGLVRWLRFDLRTAGRDALLETPMFVRSSTPYTMISSRAAPSQSGDRSRQRATIWS